MGEIVIREKANPEAFVVKYLINNYSLAYRVRYPSFYEKETKTWRIRLLIVESKTCKCCHQPLPAEHKDGGHVLVKRGEDDNYEIVKDWVIKTC